MSILVYLIARYIELLDKFRKGLSEAIVIDPVHIRFQSDYPLVNKKGEKV
jgi:hypothetical protein